MSDDTVGMLICAIVFGIIGVIFLSSYGIVSWAISNTRSGQRWERWFGEERAIFIMRFVVGPFMILMSLFVIWMTVSGKMPEK